MCIVVLLGCGGTAKIQREPLPTPERYYILLDAGHGGFDGGAVGTVTGVQEAGLNLQVALLVQAELEAAGARVLLTRTGPEALGDTKKADMARRGELLQSEGADAALSIHMNKFPDPTVKGPMAYFQAGSAEGEALAARVIAALTEDLGLPERRPNPGNNFVTRVPAAPAVLVECGFLSHPEEERRLQDPAYQSTLSKAIARGVMAYLQEGEGEEGSMEKSE